MAVGYPRSSRGQPAPMIFPIPELHGYDVIGARTIDPRNRPAHAATAPPLVGETSTGELPMQLSCRSSSKASSFSVELTDKGKQAGRRRRRSHRAGGGVAMSSTGAPRGRRGRRARDAGAACPGVILGVVLLVVAGALAFVGRSSLCKVVPPVPGNAREASRRTSPRSAKRCDIDRRRSANGEAFRSSHNRTGPDRSSRPSRPVLRAGRDQVRSVSRVGRWANPDSDRGAGSAATSGSVGVKGIECTAGSVPAV